MRRKITYYCDYCDYHNQNKLKVLKHQEKCLRVQNISDRVKHHLETLIKSYLQLGYKVDFRTVAEIETVEVFVTALKK